jgi:hypothetical protein
VLQVISLKNYLDSNDRNQTQRELFSIHRLVEFFGEQTPLDRISVSQIRRYRKHWLEFGLFHGMVNRDVSVLSGIFREPIERDTLESNPGPLGVRAYVFARPSVK